MATTFQLQVSTAADFASTVYDQSGLTSASQSVTGLTLGGTYYWRVRTTDENGTSPWSSTFSFTAIEAEICLDVHTALRLLSTGAIYLGWEGTDGTWKTVRNGNNLEVQRRESDVFNPKLYIGPTGITVCLLYTSPSPRD